MYLNSIIGGFWFTCSAAKTDSGRRWERRISV